MDQQFSVLKFNNSYSTNNKQIIKLQTFYCNFINKIKSFIFNALYSVNYLKRKLLVMDGGDYLQ